jgi:hypothetical protein
MAQAFDEWMRLYVEEPRKFGSMSKSIRRFLAEGGRVRAETSEGRLSAAWLRFLMSGKSLEDWGAQS